MIYDKIQDTIINVLEDDPLLSSAVILMENEIPDDDVNFFVRFIFGYGNLNESGNISIEEVSTLTLEVFERKFKVEEKINQFVTYLRKKLLLLPVISDDIDKSRAKIFQIAINRNFNEEWKRYDLIFSIRVIWEV